MPNTFCGCAENRRKKTIADGFSIFRLVLNMTANRYPNIIAAAIPPAVPVRPLSARDEPLLVDALFYAARKRKSIRQRQRRAASAKATSFSDSPAPVR